MMDCDSKTQHFIPSAISSICQCQILNLGIRSRTTQMPIKHQGKRQQTQAQKKIMQVPIRCALILGCCWITKNSNVNATTYAIM